MTDDLNVYSGVPGSLVAIPHPRGGFHATRDRRRDVFQSAVGGVRVGTVGSGKRQYTLSMAQLSEETFSTLLAYDQGHNGPGVLAMIDPGQRNQLTVNQSSSTSETNTTDNFTVAGSGYSIASDSVVYLRGPRTLKLSIAYAGVDGSVSLDSPSPYWYGTPVYIRPYTFWFYAKGAGSDAVVNLTAKMSWYTVAGALISTSSGSATATSSSAWTQVSVTATPPATSAYVVCSVAVSGSTVGAASTVYFDEFQLEEGSAAQEWRPGTGVVPVQVMSLTDQWPWQAPQYRSSPTLVLQEVGP